MTDIFSPQLRHKMMSSIRSKDTTPEKIVRSWLHAHGYRFRIHRKDLPGCPDIVLPRYKCAIFVHGCFWHQHEGCKLASIPATNVEFWTEKFRRNLERDAASKKAIEALGWKVIVIWECEVRGKGLEEKLLQITETLKPLTSSSLNPSSPKEE